MSIKEYYDKQRLGISAEDMTARVMRAAQAQPKHRAVRKPAVIAAAAAAVVMAGGVTAAATGIINFNELFHSISVENEIFGETLIGCVENVKTTISNEDYSVALKGVTGSPTAILANIEIARTDGQPINGEDVYVNLKDISLANYDSFSGGGCDSQINEQGILSIDWDYRMGYDEMLAGEVMMSGPMLINGCVNIQNGGKINEIDWTIEFDYTPSKESLKEARAADTNKNCILNCEISLNDNEYFPLKCDISEIVLTNTFGVVKGVILDEVFMMPSRGDANDIRLIRDNGTEVTAHIMSANGDSNGNSINFILRYIETGSRSEELAIDLSDINAISINGIVYELS